jgi:Fuseless
MDEFPDSPRAEEPLLEHAVDMDGIETTRSLNRARSGTPRRILTVRSQSQPPPTNGSTTTAGSGGLQGQQSQQLNSTPEGDNNDGQSPIYALAVRNTDSSGANKNDAVHELEVEILTEAVADAVADAVGEVVQEAVQEAVQTAMEDARFDFKANLYTLVAVTAAVLLERGVWNTWDYYFGDESLESNVGSLVVGLMVLIIIRILNLPLATTVPGR